jgi:hypothetical protein
MKIQSMFFIAAFASLSALTFAQELPMAGKQMSATATANDRSADLSSRPVVVIREFSVNGKTGWPYG